MFKYQYEDMGYSGKLSDKMLAQKLRKQGLSYGEILEKVSVSKGTISLWCKDIELTEEQKNRLQSSKLLGQKKGSIVASENKRAARIVRTRDINTLAKKDVSTISKRDRFMLGIALYVAEGDKMDGKGGFTNADPRLISFMTKWLQEFTELPLNRIHGALWIHDGLSEKNARKYWSDLTGIPEAQFYKTYVAKLKPDSKKVRKNIHQYGVFAIRFSHTAVHRQLMGWIYGTFGDKMN